MSTNAQSSGSPAQETEKHNGGTAPQPPPPQRGWKTFFGRSERAKAPAAPQRETSSASSDDDVNKDAQPARWSMGILNDQETDEVPGTVLLMSKLAIHNAPLGLRNTPARTSASSLPSPFPPGLEPVPGMPVRPSASRTTSKQSIRDLVEEMKRTADGRIILEPQPDDSLNDPLNWPAWRRNVALVSLGFYCMIGGGMTTVLAAGFTNVSETYDVPVSKVSLTTGLYMMGLGLGSVVASPTAILFGKRPVYLVASVLFSISAVWCALSPNFTSLLIARIFQGLAVSPVECLPSATIAEIFFLHERAYRLGIYTLLLLGGKNLIPLVSAAIIQRLDWQWVFWTVALVVGFCTGLLFFFVPETFWDRTPRPKARTRGRRTARETISALFTPRSRRSVSAGDRGATDGASEMHRLAVQNATAMPSDVSLGSIAQRRQQKNSPHIGFADEARVSRDSSPAGVAAPEVHDGPTRVHPYVDAFGNQATTKPSTHLEVPRTNAAEGESTTRPLAYHTHSWRVEPRGEGPKTPGLHNLNSPFYTEKESSKDDYMNVHGDPEAQKAGGSVTEPGVTPVQSVADRPGTPLPYTHKLRTQPPKTFFQTLKPWNGRLRKESWLKVAIRPFILFAYPAILWSAMVYALSVGWLIVLSESVSTIYRCSTQAGCTNPYNFSALQTGLVYISPFVGGVLGTAVAGKVSDIIVRFMARRNDGIYEPEFRLIMIIPVAITTSLGLMGFGWSAQERDLWIVPTVFFGLISFGCTLGSTTAITFAVDSYRQYAGEALVTLNFSKNIFHGLVFSLFFTGWLISDGSRIVFIAVGIIQLICLTATIPMYIFGKRARMWTVRKNMMERF